MERYKSRKFLLACAALWCLTWLCRVGSIDSAGFVAGLLGTVGAYLAANVAQKKVA